MSTFTVEARVVLLTTLEVEAEGHSEAAELVRNMSLSDLYDGVDEDVLVEIFDTHNNYIEKEDMP